MRTANLDALGIEVPLRRNEFYHDDGYVDSIEGHEKELCVLYGRDYESPEKNGTEVVGICRVIKRYNWSDLEIIKDIHTYQIDFGTENYKLQVKAHEQAHALHKLDKLEILSRKIEKNFRVRINFDQLTSSEVIAHMGGIYAVLKKTNDPNQLAIKKSGIDDYMEALYIWKNSKLPERKYLFFNKL